MMTDTDRAHEAKVRRFYDDASDGGEGAGEAYGRLMGEIWHHGRRSVEEAGGTVHEAALAMEEHLMSLSGLNPGDHALDFGAGPGGATINMANMTGALFTGLSNSESLSRRARELATRTGVEDRVSFLTIGDNDYRRLAAWPDKCLDAVVFIESVCHLPDKQAFFDAAHRILRPGGRLVGLDWLQRPFGNHQTDEQIQTIIGPVCSHIRLAGLGTVNGYIDMMKTAGLHVTEAVDEYDGVPCWGSTPDEDREKWLNYDGPSGDLFQNGKKALDRARAVGVFTVGWFGATRP